jgi:surfeit locus 1 family protein
MAANARPTRKIFMTDYRRGLVPLIAAVAGALLAARLGFWQLDRAAQKVALQTALESRSRLPALDAGALARTPAAAEPQHYRPAVVSGRWIAERTLFLDNRQMDGKVGFFVVTPLQIEGTPEAVLVERGWVGRNFTDRAALPPVATPAGSVTVAGRVAPPPSRLFEFAGAASGPIRQNIDIPAYARETSLTLLPLSILQLDTPGASADGLARHWPAPAGDVQKHYGYAVQWFAIAAGIAFLYVWHRFIRPRARRR